MAALTVAPELAVFRARWEALQRQLTQAEAWLERCAAEAGRDEALAYRLRTLRAVTARLLDFAATHVAYFFDGPNPPAGYTAQYGLALALRQVGFDLEVIQQAACQRLGAAPGSEEQNVLDTADRLARRTLARALPANPYNAEPPTAITYFQKSPFIAVIPYAPVALIGLPYSAVSVKRDLLAIPHEVGHYVFWNMRAGRTYARALPPWVDDHPLGRWAEETFADVFAALVSGPVGALSLQDLLVWHDREAFLASEAGDDHPTPILRPYVYSQALRRRGPEYTALAEQLDRRWARVASRKAGALTARLPGRAARPIEEWLSMQAAPAGQRPLDFLIQAAEEALAPVTLEGEWAGQLARLAGRDLASDGTAADELDNLFPRRILEVNEAAPAEVALVSGCWEAWAQAQATETPGFREDWLAVAHARGWTHGPGDNWPRTG
ncbi:MAG: hypothetical protein JNK29_06490 [Anaerolineales bacterium]|nr:hypothetical protein [Anaerolineales bacterium]